MKTRFFAFGCSLTSYNWPTWADVVALNFDEYYPRAKGGASNYFILNNFLETFLRVDFNPETDFVALMITGVDRFSWRVKGPNWVTGGDIAHILAQPENNAHKATVDFCNSMWNQNWAIHNTWITVSTIKKLLTDRGIKHIILKGIDFEFYKEPEFIELFDLDQASVKNIDDLTALVDSPCALQTFQEDKKLPGIYFPKDNHYDGHPAPEVHLEYVEKILPQFVNEDVINKFKDLSEGFQEKSFAEFSEIFHSKRKKYVRIR
jgi:hypothetical protein